MWKRVNKKALAAALVILLAWLGTRVYAWYVRGDSGAAPAHKQTP